MKMVENKALAVSPIKSLFSKDMVKKRFEEILGKKSAGFISGVLNVACNNKLLEKADPQTILSAAVIGASLDLPIDPNLGFAYIVPYKGKAQFQMGYRGFIQLALRTGHYTRMNVVPVYENQFKSYNQLTEELDADFSTVGVGKIEGFAFYFKMVNGFEKTVFECKSNLFSHGERYSQSFKDGPWQTHTDEMCMKTLIKQTLKRWGMLSIEMQTAIKTDQAVVKDETNIDNEGALEYPDAIEADYSVEKSPFNEEPKTPADTDPELPWNKGEKK